MDKNTILNYVTETPGNTNRAVLRSMLDSMDGGGGSENSILIVHFSNDNESDPSGGWSCDTNITDIDEALKDGTPVIGIATFTLGGQITFCETVNVSFQTGTYNVSIGNGTIWKGANDQLLPTQWNIRWNS